MIGAAKSAASAAGSAVSKSSVAATAASATQLSTCTYLVFVLQCLCVMLRDWHAVKSLPSDSRGTVIGRALDRQGYASRSLARYEAGDLSSTIFV